MLQTSRPTLRLAFLAVLWTFGATAVPAAVLVPPRASIVENRGEIAIALERRLPLQSDLEIELSTQPGTAAENEDFVPTSTTLFWAAGEGGLRELIVPILDDRRLERNEYFTISVEVTKGRDSISNSRIVVLIEEDDFRRLAVRRLADSGFDPSLATEPDGRRLVLFTTPLGVAASFLSPTGAPLGDPFLVRENDGLALVVDAPAVAAGRAGRFVVAWRTSLPGAGQSRIEGRAFGRNGDPLGPIVELSEDYAGQVGEPRVAMGNRGQVVVLFSDPDGQLVGRLLTSAEILDPRPLPELASDPATPSTVRLPRAVTELPLEAFGAAAEYELAAAPTLGFVVVARPLEPRLASSRLPDAGLGDVTGVILAQAFGFDGKSRSGIVAISSDLSATGPSVAVSAEGRVVIGWTEESLDGDLDPRIAFFGRGLAVGQRLEVLELARPGDQDDVAVAMNSAGDTVAVWVDRASSGAAGVLAGDRSSRAGAAASGGGASIVARAFDAGGTPKGDEFSVAESDAETEPTDPSVTVTDDDVIDVAFQKKNKATGQPAGIFDQQIEKAITDGVCRPDDKTLCLNDLRFRVSASWSNAESEAGVANTRELTDDTGTFWFFDEENLEIVLKVLDACDFAQTFWVFAGGLTDVEVSLTVTDVEAGITRAYSNASSQPFEPIQDTSAFATCDGSTARRAPSTVVTTVVPARRSAGVSASNPCSEESLCLNGGRFQVDLEFETPAGLEGDGQPTALTDDTGSFWFFDAANVEALVKVLDACDFGGRYWVFAAGLTDVAATLTVTDTATGAVQTYENPQSTPFRPIVDTDAFASCP